MKSAVARAIGLRPVISRGHATTDSRAGAGARRRGERGSHLAPVPEEGDGNRAAHRKRQGYESARGERIDALRGESRV